MQSIDVKKAELLKVPPVLKFSEYLDDREIAEDFLSSLAETFQCFDAPTEPKLISRKKVKQPRRCKDLPFGIDQFDKYLS